MKIGIVGIRVIAVVLSVILAPAFTVAGVAITHIVSLGVSASWGTPFVLFLLLVSFVAVYQFTVEMLQKWQDLKRLQSGH